MANPFLNELPQEDFSEAFKESQGVNPDFSQAVSTVEAKPSENYFGRRIQDVLRGIDNLQATGYGAIAAVGDVTGSEGMRDYGVEGFKRNELEASFNPPSFQSFTNVDWTNPGSIFEFGSQAVAENLPMFLPGLVTGGAAGFGGGAIAKKAAQSLVTNWIKEFGEKEAAAMIAKRVAIGQTIGQAIGTQASSGLQETGSIYADMTNQGIETPGWTPIVMGQAAGLLDAIPQFRILQKTLGPAAAKRIEDYSIKKFGLSMVENTFSEGSTEGIQTIIEKLAPRIADPSKGDFTSDDWTEVVDSVIRGGISGAGIGGAVEAPMLLRPSKDPKVNEIQQDVQNRAEALVPDTEDIQTQKEDILTADLAEAMSAFDAAETNEERTAQQEKIDGLTQALSQVNPAYAPKPNESVPRTSEVISTGTEESAGEVSSKPEDELKLVTDTLKVLDATFDTPSEPPDYQEQRKQLLERRDEIKAGMAGFTPEGNSPLEELGPKETANPYSIAGSRMSASEKKGQAKVNSVIKKLKVGRVDNDQAKLVKAAYAKALSPFARLFNDSDVDFSIADKGQKMGVDIDDEGKITVSIPHPEDSVSLSPEVAEKQVEEEGIHVATYRAIRDEWNDSGRKISFRSFVSRKFENIATDIRRASSDKTVKAISDAYFKNRPENKGRTLSNEQLAGEFIRATIQRLRTGQTTEDLQVLEAQAKLGKEAVIPFIRHLVNAVALIRKAISRFANPSTSPKRFKELLSQTKKILDQYGVVSSTPEQVQDLEIRLQNLRNSITEAEKNLNDIKKQSGVPVAEPISPVKAPLTSQETQDTAQSPPSVSTGSVSETFTTSKGSTYQVFSDGTTQRTKAQRPEHGDDKGLKERTVKTVYVNPDFAKEVGMWQTSSSKQKRVLLRDGKVTLLSLNEKENKLGRDVIHSENSFSDAPEKGKAPLELFENAENGLYKGTHPGNEITSLSSEKAQPAKPETKLEAPEGITAKQVEADKRVFSEIDTNLISKATDTLPENDNTPYTSKFSPFFGDLAALRTRYTRGIAEDVTESWNYIAKNGYITTATRLLEKSIRGLSDAERLVAASFLYDQSQNYRDAISRDKSLTIAERQELRDRSNAIQRGLKVYIENEANSWGRMGPILNWIKHNFGGQAVTTDYQTLTFNAIEKVEQALSRPNLAPLADTLQQKLTKGVAKVFTLPEYKSKLSSLIRQATSDPDKLFTDIYGSLARKYKKQFNGILNAAASRMITDTSEPHLEDVARKMAAMIDLGLSDEKQTSKDGTKIIESALQKFARDHLQGFLKEKTSNRPSKVNILQTIIVNDSYKKQFIQFLRQEVASKFDRGENSPGFKSNFDGVFEQMESSVWSDGIKNDALNEVARSLQYTIPPLVSRTFGAVRKTNLFSLKGEERTKAIEEIKQKFRESLKAVPQEVVDQLVEDIDTQLTEDAARYLEGTFGFKRTTDENGQIVYELTDKGNLKGGKGIRDALRLNSNVKSLREITGMGVSDREAFIRNLANDYVTELGMPQHIAERLEALFRSELRGALDWQQDKDIQTQLDRIRENLKDGKKKPATNKGIIDKLLDSALRGYLGEEEIYESIRKNYKRSELPDWSPELAQEMFDDANQMSLMPEGNEKDMFRQQIANKLANASGLSLGDWMTSWWYFSLLSGPGTFLFNNPAANAANILFNTTVWCINNPRNAAKTISALMSSFAGKSAAWDNFFQVMETGYVPHGFNLKYSSDTTGTQIPQLAALPVERVTEQDSKLFATLARGVKIGRYEFGPKNLQRFMVATDQFFATVGKEVASASEGLVATEAMKQEAAEQADLEFSTGRDRGTDDRLYRQRYNQILDDKVAAANPYIARNVAQRGLETSFSQEPKGAIGSLAKWLGGYATQYPFAKLIFPFTNIVANVFNESLNYTPGLGLVRLVKDKEGVWEVFDAQGNRVKDKTILIKQGIGLMLMVTLYGLSGDDDDSDIVIYGKGPDDPVKRRALQARGWKPNSVKIGNMYFSYLLTPAAPALAVIGEVADIRRSGKLEDKDMTERAFTMTAIAATAIFNQSFLQGGVDAAGILTSPEPGKKFQEYVGGIVSSLTTPNLVKQIGRWVNPTVYEAPNFWGQIVKNIPVVNAATLQPALNVFGKPITNEEIPVVGRNVSFYKDGDPTLNYYYSQGLKIPGYQQSFIIGDRAMTEEEKRIFVQDAGPKLEQALQRIRPAVDALVKAGNLDKAQDLVNDTASDIKKAARNRLRRQETIDVNR